MRARPARHVEHVRLLPDQERPDRVGAFASIGADLLGPPRAGVALRCGDAARRGEDRAVPGEAAGEQLRSSPRREVGGVPAVHLEVELALPGVGDQSGLRGRLHAGAVHRGEVLREHDASFEFVGAGIVSWRSDRWPRRRARSSPTPARSRQRPRRMSGRSAAFWAEAGDQVELILIGGQFERVRFIFRVDRARRWCESSTRYAVASSSRAMDQCDRRVDSVEV